MREADGDWLDAREEVDDGPPPLRTTVTVEKPKSIIAWNRSPDIGFDRSINAYRGCEHGCIYCFARPTHAFHDLSPGLDFETKLFAKPDAAKILREELAKPGYVVRPMAMGTNTDPYQPIEAKWRITRSVLEVLAETKHPVTITTKSDRVLRDLDILAPMAADGLASVALSVTSLTPEISRTLEPRAPSGRKRLAAVRRSAEAGRPDPSSRSPRSFPASPTMRSSISSRRRPRPARSAPSSCRCGCPTRSRPCSAPGSTSISPTAPTR